MSEQSQTIVLPVERRALPVAAPTAWLVCALLMIDGMHLVFAKILSAYLPPVVAAFWVITIASAQIGVFAAAQGRYRWTTLRRHLWFFVAIGALTATSTSITFAAIKFIDPGAAALLNQTVTLFSIAFGVVWLRERLTRAQAVGAAICLLGVGIITFQPGDYLRIGALMILCSSCCYALHAAIVKRYGSDIWFIEFFLWRVTVMALFLFIASVGLGQWQWPSAEAWLWLLVVGTVDIVISRGLYYLVLRRLKVSMHALMLTASPIVAMLWSYFLFSVQPTAQQLLGGAAVLTGIVIVTVRRK
jgi:drug/metabolite transporter (DMT)-like permease